MAIVMALVPHIPALFPLQDSPRDISLLQFHKAQVHWMSKSSDVPSKPARVMILSTRQGWNLRCSSYSQGLTIGRPPFHQPSQTFPGRRRTLIASQHTFCPLPHFWGEKKKKKGTIPQVLSATSRRVNQECQMVSKAFSISG